MSKKQKKQLEKEQKALEEQEAASKAVERKASRTGIIAIGLVIAVGLIIFGAFYYRSQVAPFQQPVVSVDGETITMGYFLKRAKMSPDDPGTVLYQLIDEEIIRQTAKSLNLDVTPEDINGALLFKASTENLTEITENTTAKYLTEPEYKKWYKAQLEYTGLSNAEYREKMRITLLSAKLQQALAQMLPTTANQVHLNVILAKDSKAAADAKARIEGGESFADVARDVSLDPNAQDTGGDEGWFPRGVLPYDNVIFALDIGAVSDSVAVTPNSASSRYVLFMVSEKAVDREIDESNMNALRSNALSNWLAQEEATRNIQFIYDFNDPENQAWVTWQISR